MHLVIDLFSNISKDLTTFIGKAITLFQSGQFPYHQQHTFPLLKVEHDFCVQEHIQKHGGKVNSYKE